MAKHRNLKPLPLPPVKRIYATEQVRVSVTEQDLKNGKPKNHDFCPGSLASVRTPEMQEAYRTRWLKSTVQAFFWNPATKEHYVKIWSHSTASRRFTRIVDGNLTGEIPQPGAYFLMPCARRSGKPNRRPMRRLGGKHQSPVIQRESVDRWGAKIPNARLEFLRNQYQEQAL